MTHRVLLFHRDPEHLFNMMCHVADTSSLQSDLYALKVIS